MDDLRYTLYVTFVREDRYLFFLNGLGITLLLTFASFLLGTALGIALCAALRARQAWLRRAARIIMSFFMGIPTLVLLMVLAYVVFGASVLPVLWIVILGLTLRSGAYLAEIFDTALNTVAPGELEAARTLGMTRWQAFRYVALPQTVDAALPLYQNQFIAGMQETSVVGYLAVVDMTRAASIVSSRTMDAFAGLITVTILYFFIGAVVKLCFRLATTRRHQGVETA